MTLTYSLTEDDYVQAHLFFASKNSKIKKRRKKEWLIFSVIFCLAGIAYALTLPKPEGYYFLAYYFFGAAVISFFVYPPYQRNYYINHYKKYVAATFQKRINKETITTFNDDFIEGTDLTGTSKLKFTDIAIIHETGSYIYLILKSGPYITFPKTQLNNVDQLHNALSKLSKNLNIPFISELNWKWK